MEHAQSTLKNVIQELFSVDLQPEFTRPDEQFGDFATNVALQLAGRLGKNPREIATQLAGELQTKLANAVSEVTVAGPGFINITLSDHTVMGEAAGWTEHAKPRAGQTVVIETNNPNPFKDLHIGHAYNCIVADTLANLLEASGAETHRVSYHGDVGLHVGKSMWAILKFINGDPVKLDEVEPAERAKFMSRMYVEGAAAYKDDAGAKETIEELARQSFKLDDLLFKQVYEICKTWSFEYLNHTIERLGSALSEKRYLESEADAAGTATVKAHVGDVFEESEGAIVFKGEKYDLHTRVFIASRGTSLYEARDLGLMQLKQKDFNPNSSYIVTGGEQRDYFKVVIKAAELVLPELSGVTQNIPTGTVKLSTGKMSSRTGDVLNIEWLFEKLTEAVKNRGGEADPQTIIGALRYALLKVRVGGDVVFDVNESVSLEGNSGPYLQYAHARARSILGKADVPEHQEIETFEPGERSLARKMSEYSEVVEKSVTELTPHAICTYLYELSQAFNRFYEKNHVIGDPRQNIRLQLVGLYADILKDGLTLLGIPAPERL